MHCVVQLSGIPVAQHLVTGSCWQLWGGFSTAQVVVRQKAQAGDAGRASQTAKPSRATARTPNPRFHREVILPGRRAGDRPFDAVAWVPGPRIGWTIAIHQDTMDIRLDPWTLPSLARQRPSLSRGGLAH